MIKKITMFWTSPDAREYPFLNCPERFADLGNSKKIGKAAGFDHEKNLDVYGSKSF